MNKPAGFFTGRNTQAAKYKLSRDTVFLIGDLLPLLDFAGVLLAAYLGTLIYASWLSPGAATLGLWDAGGRAALAAAVLAPFILCDRAFVAFASGGQTAALLRCFAVRFLMFVGVVVTLGLASHSLESLPRGWLVLWFAGSLCATAIIRLVLIANLRRLERKGILTETVAVVGAGPVADRLIRHLLQTRGGSVEILGVFDDRVNRSENGSLLAAGSVTDLTELGKTRSIDWILLALPGSAESRLQAIVHRLKALAVPVGLCPQHVGLALPNPEFQYPGAGQPVTLLADRPVTRWDSAHAMLQTVLPHWVITLLSLPFTALKLVYGSLRVTQPPMSTLSLALDPYDLQRFTGIAARFGQKRYGYVVTPNADHLIRLHRESSFRALYADAAYVLLDSRFISHLLRLTRKLSLPVCTGSDLTAKLFAEVIKPDDRVVLIGNSAEQAARLAERYGLKQLAHFNPPMGFIHDPAAVETCLQFVEAQSPFRYCLLAVAAPQQEMVAHQLKTRGIARGLALCVGGSIGFLTGRKQRAPLWMQRSGFEWLFRLAHAPGRMAQRYLVQGPRLFGLLRRTEIVPRVTPDSPHCASRAVARSIAMPRRPPSAFSRKLDRLPKVLPGWLTPSSRTPSPATLHSRTMSEAATAP